MDVAVVMVAVDMNAAVRFDVEEAGPLVSTSNKIPLFKCFTLSSPLPASDGQRRSASVQTRGRESEELCVDTHLFTSTGTNSISSGHQFPI